MIPCSTSSVSVIGNLLTCRKVVFIVVTQIIDNRPALNEFLTMHVRHT